MGACRLATRRRRDGGTLPRRECEEEIGLVPGRVERLGGFFPTPGICDEETDLFPASDLRAAAGDSPHSPDEDEDIEPRP